MNTTPNAVPTAPPKPSEGLARKLTFARANEFQAELRQRVDRYFQSTGRRQRDCPQAYIKTAILLVGLGTLYTLLVFAASAWWVALPLAVLLGLVAAGVGFNIQHDGGHGAYSDRPWVNKLMALTLDLIGASS
jgi:linoleoyl-CoA desaturase